ncbi:phenazine biosynthesis FMN-dependent oxidase PhzG [Streptomyces purpureus]|uniref:Pyridoxamine 5'-phosphate oxidase n=1 Tax=Streptomyces purpureus TaxID=1951 RepID=A0A918HBQ7_9ACTN|nr:phenazine biosynthesis FMN-dependent oxidase PhzG [Streptomyces purpureus]GGT50720.1 pyridoxamine 5'-phosphate oxidase [Streptomyces purpureus]
MSEHNAAAGSESLTGTVEADFPEYAAPPSEPIGLLRRWLEHAVTVGVREPRALALATADAQGRPSSRTVVLNRLTETGLVFATHDGSRKERELRDNAWASGLLYWRETSRQVAVRGPVRRLSAADADALWASRPPFTHAMTAASRQSRPLDGLDDVAELRARADQLAAAGPLPRPERYIGLELVPEEIEFWANGSGRLHERLRYDRTAEGWRTVRLAP